jgi:hypothetical protein
MSFDTCSRILDLNPFLKCVTLHVGLVRAAYRSSCKTPTAATVNITLLRFIIMVYFIGCTHLVTDVPEDDKTLVYIKK